APAGAGGRGRPRRNPPPPADLAQRLPFRLGQERRLVGRDPTQERLRVVDRGAREPRDAWHLTRDDVLPPPTQREVVVVDDRRPERIEIVDRPAPQRRV